MSSARHPAPGAAFADVALSRWAPDRSGTESVERTRDGANRQRAQLGWKQLHGPRKIWRATTRLPACRIRPSNRSSQMAEKVFRPEQSAGQFPRRPRLVKSYVSGRVDHQPRRRDHRQSAVRRWLPGFRDAGQREACRKPVIPSSKIRHWPVAIPTAAMSTSIRATTTVGLRPASTIETTIMGESEQQMVGNTYATHLDLFHYANRPGRLLPPACKSGAETIEIVATSNTTMRIFKSISPSMLSGKVTAGDDHYAVSRAWCMVRSGQTSSGNFYCRPTELSDRPR